MASCFASFIKKENKEFQHHL
jgi:hypothetical protein